MQYFKDDADGSEYIYSELEPDYCHIIFPCFDQPDLKATHKSCIVAPEDWEVISNSAKLSVTAAASFNENTQDVKAALKRFEIPADSPILSSFDGGKVKVHELREQKRYRPISMLSLRDLSIVLTRVQSVLPNSQMCR